MSCYSRHIIKFSKTKVHWRTYNDCLFVLYLASVAFGYGWISDTKFLKFSDKDWICKIFLDMDQELKTEYLLTSVWITYYPVMQSTSLLFYVSCHQS